MNPAPQKPAIASQPDAVHVLHPGDVVCAERGVRLETLLGSCVAIVLTDPRRTVGVMCHVVHSRLPAHGQQDLNTAYGEAALAAMAQRLLARGIAPALCEAFLVGGGNMFPALVGEAHVGAHNVRWALAALARFAQHHPDYSQMFLERGLCRVSHAEVDERVTDELGNPVGAGAAGERHVEAVEHPEDGYEAHRSEAQHHHRDDAGGLDEASVEERQARRHEENQGCSEQQPGR